jgi:hypothetical protein
MQVSQSPIKVDNNGYSTSLYKDSTASDDDIKNAIAKLLCAFPMGNKEDEARFFAILASRIKANAMSKKRLDDAVNNLIDNYKYPTIKIADVIGYDKRVRLYTYQEYSREVTQSETAHMDFMKYGNIDGVTYFYRKSELTKAKLQ